VEFKCLSHVHGEGDEEDEEQRQGDEQGGRMKRREKARLKF